MVSELADISLGDAWLKEIQEHDNQGASIVISRSELGEEILHQTQKLEEIYLEAIPHEKAIESQQGALARKKQGVGSRLRFLRCLGKSKPAYDQIFSWSITGLIGAALIFFNAMISKVRTGQKIIKSIPENILKRYCFYIFKLTKR